jgi:hypothetical protein
MTIDKTSLASVAAVIVGAIYVTLCYRVPWLIDLRPLYHFALSLVVLLPISLALVATARGPAWIVPLFVAVGISIGVITDVALDKNDRNIFPIEILIWNGFLAPAVLGGAAIGESIRKPQEDSAGGGRLNAGIGAIMTERPAILPRQEIPGTGVAHDLHPLSLREILLQALRMFRRKFWVLFAISALIWIPEDLALLEVGRRLAMPVSLGVEILRPLMNAALAMTAINAYIDRNTTIGGPYRLSFANWVSVVATSLLVRLLTAILYLFLLVPGVYFGVCWSLVMPIMLIERRFGIASMRRSYHLVQDTLPTAFVVWFVSVPFLLDFINIARLPPFLWQILLSSLAAIGGAYSMVATVVYYLDCRWRAEKFDIRDPTTQMVPEAARSSDWQ